MSEARGRHYVNAVLALAGGAVVGFLFLGEFRLAVLLPVMVALAVFGVMTLIGVIRRQPRLSLWSLFLLAAMVPPLLIDGSIVGLPRCGPEVTRGAACVGSDRDYRTPFYFEVGIFAVSAIASAMHLRSSWRSHA